MENAREVGTQRDGRKSLVNYGKLSFDGSRTSALVSPFEGTARKCGELVIGSNEKRLVTIAWHRSFYSCNRPLETSFLTRVMRHRRSTRFFILLSLTVLIAACNGPVSPERAEPALRTSVLPDDGWTRVVRSGFGGGQGFSFSVPRGFEKLNLQPIDSDAAVYVRGDASIHYDFGAYTSAPTVEGTDGVSQKIRIGGRSAIVVSYRR